MQGRHFRRPGWVWVSADIDKGQKERWIPVITDLEPIWEDLATLADDEYALPAQRFRDPGINRVRRDPAPPRLRTGDLATGEGRGGQGGDPAQHLDAHAPARLLRPRRTARRGSRPRSRRWGASLATPRSTSAPRRWTSSPPRCDTSRSARTTRPERLFQVEANRAAKPEEAPTGFEPVYTALQAAA